jgi:transposase
VVAVRTEGLRVLCYDEELEALRMLADCREELTRRRVQTVNRLQRLLAELTPGKAKKDITAPQAKAILSSVRSRDVVGKTRRRLAAEQLTELMAVEKKIKALTKELKAMVIARGSTLMELPGVGSVVAARISRRCRGRGTVRRPEPVRVLDWHRTPGRLLGGVDQTPVVSGR